MYKKVGAQTHQGPTLWPEWWLAASILLQLHNGGSHVRCRPMGILGSPAHHQLMWCQGIGQGVGRANDGTGGGTSTLGPPLQYIAGGEGEPGSRRWHSEQRHGQEQDNRHYGRGERYCEQRQL